MTKSNDHDIWLEIAKNIQDEADVIGLSRSSAKLRYGQGGRLNFIQRFDIAVTDTELVGASRQLFADGHYARAVEEAFKCLNNAVKDKSEIYDLDGAGLMRTAFSANSPVLKLNLFRSQSDRDEQQGYMDLFAGSMTGIRNPRAHEHRLEDEPEVALEVIVFANHLMRKLEAATKSQPRASAP